MIEKSLTDDFYKRNKKSQHYYSYKDKNGLVFIDSVLKVPKLPTLSSPDPDFSKHYITAGIIYGWVYKDSLDLTGEEKSKIWLNAQKMRADYQAKHPEKYDKEYSIKTREFNDNPSVYIGQTVKTFGGRFGEHLASYDNLLETEIEKGVEHNKTNEYWFGYALADYLGKSPSEVKAGIIPKILDVVPYKNVNQAESFYIKAFNSADSGGLNSSKGSTKEHKPLKNFYLLKFSRTGIIKSKDTITELVNKIKNQQPYDIDGGYFEADYKMAEFLYDYFRKVPHYNYNKDECIKIQKSLKSDSTIFGFYKLHSASSKKKEEIMKALNSENLVNGNAPKTGVLTDVFKNDLNNYINTSNFKTNIRINDSLWRK